MEKREWGFLKFVYISSFFLFGLFKEYSACIYTGLYGGLLFLCLRKRKSLKFYRNPESAAVTAIVGFYLFTCLYGVDKGMSLIGFWRMLGVLFFLLLVMQISEKERQELLALIPAAGVLMTCVGFTARLFDGWYSFFYVADRLGGFFQYPNVYALFCLVGVIVLAKEWEDHFGKSSWKPLAGIVILLAGILLSGSRTVFFLLILSMAVMAICSKQLRLPVLIAGLGVLAAGILYGILTGNVQNVSRFLTTSLNSSTLLGRLLYAKDGVKLSISHPFGLGYLGYYYLEPKIQSGFYSVRFIHNDFLQLALDVGIIPCLVFAAVWVKNIFGKDRTWEKRLLLLIMGLHFLMDFDLEFVSVWYLVVLALDVCRGKEREIFSASRRENKKAAQSALRQTAVSANMSPRMRVMQAVVAFSAAAALYTGCAMIPRYLGNPEISSALLPFYTESNAEVLARTTDAEAAVVRAHAIIKQNPYIPEAYDALAAAAFQQENYKEMTTNKKKSLELQKYNLKAYDRYVQLLSKAITACSQEAEPDMEQVMHLFESVTEIPGLLKETKNATDPLAYRTKDAPEFALSEETQAYLEQVAEVLGE